MNDVISIALAGIGGYGNSFVTALLDAPTNRHLRLTATIDPKPTTCQRLAELKARKIPHYESLDAFFAQGRADLVVISTPLQLHAQHTCQALAHGSHVLCEKPLCVTLEQAAQMRHAREAAGKIVSIGYQWSFSKAIQKLKADVMSGALGRPIRFKSLVLWPRDEAYYARNSWAGAKHDAQGNLVLDSPVNNACAHYLHNMLYVLGSQIDRSAAPAGVNAELYRAHSIQNYDTAALRVQTRKNVELLFIVSHSTDKNFGPILRYEFENATVEFTDRTGATLAAKFSDGTVRNYGSPHEGHDNKLWQTIDAIQGRSPQLCGIEASLPHAQCVLAAQASAPEIIDFPRSQIQISGEGGRRKTIVSGLGERLKNCYEKWKLPSETGETWARKSQTVTVGDAE